MIGRAHVLVEIDFSLSIAPVLTRMMSLTMLSFMMSLRIIIRIIISIWIPKRENMTGWTKTSLVRAAAGPAFIIALSRRTRLMKITTPKILKPSHSSLVILRSPSMGLIMEHNMRILRLVLNLTVVM